MQVSLSSEAKKVAAFGMEYDKTVFMLSASLTKKEHFSFSSHKKMNVLFGFRFLSRKMSYKRFKRKLLLGMDL